jgi:hypothetical protein
MRVLGQLSKLSMFFEMMGYYNYCSQKLKIRIIESGIKQYPFYLYILDS